MEYRQKTGKDAWHFCTNCSNWPTTDYRTEHTKPTTGELCNECKGKRDNGTCKSS